jgi:hypothetical protein
MTKFFDTLLLIVAWSAMLTFLWFFLDFDLLIGGS